MKTSFAAIADRFVRAFMMRSARVARYVGERRVTIQIVVGAVAGMLGFWGWTRHNPPADLSGWFDNVFRTAQLVTLQFPTHLDQGVGWRLQIARLLVPAVALFATINVLVGAITRPARLALARFTEDHMIVCGQAQLTEAALKSLAKRGRQIITVGPSVDAARREALEDFGLAIIEADPFQPVTFRALNLAHASALILTHVDDLENVELAMLAIAAAEKRGDDMLPLVLAAMIGSEDLARELDLALDRLARKYHVRYHRLCPDREGLRAELRRFAPVFAKRDYGAPSRVLVVGLDGDWQQVVMQLIVSSQDHPDAPPNISFVLTEAEAADLESWRAAKPELELVARFEVLPRGASLLPAVAAAVPLPTPPGAAPPHAPPDLVVVLRPDSEAVATALALRRPDNPFGLADQPILVRRSKEDHLLAQLGRAEVDDRSLGGIVAFGGLVRPETIERVLDRRGDEIAIALHASYRDNIQTLGTGSPAALATWDELPENLRNANRATADHAPILFAAIGLRLLKANKAGGVRETVLTDKEIETLARIEHRCWMADRIDRGWIFGEERNELRRIHHSLRPFENLSKDEQDKDRSQVRALIVATKNAGFQIVPCGA